MKALIALFLVAWAWIFYEIYIAPTVDENQNEIRKDEE
jgi:hypothetical protein